MWGPGATHHEQHLGGLVQRASAVGAIEHPGRVPVKQEPQEPRRQQHPAPRCQGAQVVRTVPNHLLGGRRGKQGFHTSRFKKLEGQAKECIEEQDDHKHTSKELQEFIFNLMYLPKLLEHN